MQVNREKAGVTELNGEELREISGGNITIALLKLLPQLIIVIVQL